MQLQWWGGQRAFLDQRTRRTRGQVQDEVGSDSGAKGTASAKALGQIVFSARKMWEGLLGVSSGSLRRESVGREGSLLWGLRRQALAFPPVGGSLRAGSRKMSLDLDAPQKG